TPKRAPQDPTHAATTQCGCFVGAASVCVCALESVDGRSTGPPGGGVWAAHVPAKGRPAALVGAHGHPPTRTRSRDRPADQPCSLVAASRVPLGARTWSRGCWWLPT